MAVWPYFNNTSGTKSDTTRLHQGGKYEGGGCYFISNRLMGIAEEWKVGIPFPQLLTSSAIAIFQFFVHFQVSELDKNA